MQHNFKNRNYVQLLPSQLIPTINKKNIPWPFQINLNHFDPKNYKLF